MKLFITIIFPILIIPEVILGQESARQELIEVYHSSKELKDDLAYLFERIEAIHVDPYTVNSKTKIYSQIDEAKTRLMKPMNSLEFWRVVNPIVTNLYDGHTVLGLSAENIFLADFYFPFFVEFAPSMNAILVKKNLTVENNLIPGDEITSINGKSSKQIIQNLTQNVSGEMMSFRRVVTELIFAPLLFWNYDYEKEFELVYERNGKANTIKVNPVSKEQYLSQFEFSFTGGIEPYSLEIINPHKVALMRFNSFASERVQFQEFLKTSFKKIQEQEIQSLIVDMRKNDGGNSNLGDDFLKYVSNKPFTQYGDILVKISPEVKEQYPNYKQENGYVISNSGDERTLIEPHPDSIRFQGKLYVLVSNFTFSSATDLAWCIKHYGIGKLIGEETGQWGVNFGELIYTKLPNTGLAFRVGHKKFYCVGADDESRHGAIPDYEIKDNLETKVDEVLEYTLRQISENGTMHNKH